MIKDTVTLIPVDSTDDIREIATMARAIWTEHFTPIIGSAQVEYMLGKFQSEQAMSLQMRQEHYRYFRIEKDGSPAGYTAVVCSPGAADLLLSKFYIFKEQRGRGIGKKALSLVERIAKDKSLSSTRLTVNRRNTSSIEIYLKLGFVIEGEGVFDIGKGFVMEDYLMRKTITFIDGK
jgi:RimJ/RimL family protein N-acetyltransferase